MGSTRMCVCVCVGGGGVIIEGEGERHTEILTNRERARDSREGQRDKERMGEGGFEGGRKV